MSGKSNERAEWAWKKVAEVAKKPNAQQKRYGTLARKLPAMLHNSGLGQTVAFLYSKKTDSTGKTGDGLLLDHLVERAKRVVHLANDPVGGIFALKTTQYRLLTNELNETAQWLKRFAEGRLGEEEN